MGGDQANRNEGLKVYLWWNDSECMVIDIIEKKQFFKLLFWWNIYSGARPLFKLFESSQLIKFWRLEMIGLQVLAETWKGVSNKTLKFGTIMVIGAQNYTF